MNRFEPRHPVLRARRITGSFLLLTVLGCGLAINAGGQASTASPKATPSNTTSPNTASPKATSSNTTSSKTSHYTRKTPYQPTHFPKRAEMYYHGVWGIDSLLVRSTESGELVRFSYRVVDPVRAKQLNDKKLEPALYDFRARVKLAVPSLEKVGQLRQSSTPEAGRDYWMAFSDPHRTVKRGDRVTIVIGTFRADGLVVE